MRPCLKNTKENRRGRWEVGPSLPHIPENKMPQSGSYLIISPKRTFHFPPVSEEPRKYRLFLDFLSCSRKLGVLLPLRTQPPSMCQLHSTAAGGGSGCSEEGVDNNQGHSLAHGEGSSPTVKVSVPGLLDVRGWQKREVQKRELCSQGWTGCPMQHSG